MHVTCRGSISQRMKCLSVGGGTWKYSDEEMIGELSSGILSESPSVHPIENS